jgi:hypothetical protein
MLPSATFKLGAAAHPVNALRVRKPTSLAARKTKGPHLQAFPVVELAGLEPATSWVRSRWKASPRLAIARHWLNNAGSALCGYTVLRGRLAPRIDQNLTTRTDKEGRCSLQDTLIVREDGEVCESAGAVEGSRAVQACARRPPSAERSRWGIPRIFCAPYGWTENPSATFLRVSTR